MEPRIEHDAVLVGVVGGEGVAALVGAAIDGEFVCLLHGCPEHGILPVCSFAECLDLFVGIASLVVEIGLLKLCPFGGVEQVEVLAHTAQPDAVAIRDVGFLLTKFPFLGGDEDDTVGTTRTVDGGGTHVLQHFDALDVVGVDGGKRIEAAFDGSQPCPAGGSVFVVDETIDHVKGFVAGIHRVAATDADAALCSWLSAGCGHVQSGHLSAQGSVEGAGCAVLKHVCLDSHDRTCQLCAALGAVAYHDHVVEEVALFGEFHLDVFFVVIDGEGLWAVAGVGDGEFDGQRLHADGEVSVDVGGHAPSAAILDCGSCYGVAIQRVGYGAADGLCLCG